MSKEKSRVDSATMLRLLAAATREETATPEVLAKYAAMSDPECEKILLDFIQEERDLHRLCMRQSDLLTGVVNAIRGKPPERTLWSHHDAPELAEGVVKQLAQYQQFAAYCRSCALSGESDPQTFEQFVETMKSKETTRDTEA